MAIGDFTTIVFFCWLFFAAITQIHTYLYMCVCTLHFLQCMILRNKSDQRTLKKT